MTVEELIEQLRKHPKDMNVILLDHRMNCYYANGDGTPEGIYPKFDIETITLGDYPDMNIETDSLSLAFENYVDYDNNCNKQD